MDLSINMDAIVEAGSCIRGVVVFSMGRCAPEFTVLNLSTETRLI